MSKRYSRIDSQKFKVFEVDARSFTKSILTGDPERDNRNVSLLLATINAVNSMAGPRDAMRSFVDMLVQLTEAERGVLLLLEGGELRVDVIRDSEGQDLTADEPISKSIPRRVLETGESIYFMDAPGEVELSTRASIASLGLRSVMCAPLRVRDQVFGVMYVDSRYSKDKFGDEDLRFFEAMSQQVAVTLENIRMSQTMVDAERMATIGQMTSMILHDLNNPMTAVDNYARMIAGGDYPPDKVVEMAGEIQGASGHVMELLRSLRDYARGNVEYSLRPTDLSELVGYTLKQLADRFGRLGVRLTTDLPHVGAVPLDPHRMERVITNLVVNAMEAMPEGGDLAVATRIVGEDEVELSVTDTGPGIAAEVHQRLFEPFVTHGKARGTGLGLAIVKQIVDNHGGTIAVSSVVGTGASFRIRLPSRGDE